MAEYENFDRQYRLSAGKVGGAGFEIGETSNDQPVSLHISFNFEKTDLQTQNTGKVTVWNLNDTQLASLKQKDCALSLKAGYGNRMSLIFSGVISHASTSLDGADRKTEIEVVDNLVQIRDTYVSVSYQGKVSWRVVFDSVVAQIGAVVTYSHNAEFVDITNGFSFVGKAKDILTKGCNCCGLSWSIQNGVVQIKRIGDVMSKDVYVLSSDTGLVGIPISVLFNKSNGSANSVSAESASAATASDNTAGWDVEYLLNGAINIDDYVKIESRAVTGYFRVYSIEYEGDNVSGDWICKARLLEVSGS